MPASLSHATICASDFAASLAFYDAALGALGLVRAAEFGDEEELAHAIQDSLREVTGTPEQLADVLAGVLAGHRVPAGTIEAFALFEL